jgi:hypothetical protein
MENVAISMDPVERRAEPRKQAPQYHSVELSINGLSFSYQFKIWNMASKSMCVMVREDSAVLSRLKVGDKLSMKYYTNELSCPVEQLETEIRHITKDEGRFKGHYLVGLSIVNDENAFATH